ncbi:MAG: hypothetical protein EG826_09965 [Deltaproteobacteria bacterium]|nr:hypothetical protein [Deltaproteobacteria bacterium]
MSRVKKTLLYVSGILLLLTVFGAPVIMAGGPPLKDKLCGTCHKDLGAILPKKHPDVDKTAPCLSCHKSDAAKTEATKFSTEIHKIHQGGKTKLECAACHVL